MPGEKIAGPLEAEAIRSETDWTFIDLSGEEIIVEGDFYLAYIQKMNIHIHQLLIGTQVLSLLEETILILMVNGSRLQLPMETT